MTKNPMLFSTDAWLKQFHEEVNKSEAYRQAAKTWEGDFYFVIEPEGLLTEPVYMYMDLWHGISRDAFIAKDPTLQSPEFVISAPVGTWKDVIELRLDPRRGRCRRREPTRRSAGPLDSRRTE